MVTLTLAAACCFGENTLDIVRVSIEARVAMTATAVIEVLIQSTW